MTESFANVDTLVLEGGAIPGISLIGVAYELESRGILAQIKNFAGTSVGAVCATALACGASASYLDSVLQDFPLTSLLDYSYNPIRCVYRLWTGYGLCSGSALLDLAQKVVLDLTGHKNLTFKELKQTKNSNLVIVATNVETQRPVYFSHVTTPNMSLAQAVRLSASIPLMYVAQRHDGDLFVDGGIADNLPFRAFDRDLDTGKEKSTDAVIGVKYFSSLARTPTIRKVGGPIGFALALIETFYNRSLNYVFHAGDAWVDRTICVPAGNVSLLNFFIGEPAKLQLIESGRTAAADFLDGKQTPQSVERRAAYIDFLPKSGDLAKSRRDRILLPVDDEKNQSDGR